MDKIFGDMLYNDENTGFMDKLRIDGEIDKENYLEVVAHLNGFAFKVFHGEEVHPKDVADFCMLCYNIPQFKDIKGVDKLEGIVLDLLDTLSNR